VCPNGSYTGASRLSIHTIRGETGPPERAFEGHLTPDNGMSASKHVSS
jgi:hypothetical protein